MNLSMSRANTREILFILVHFHQQWILPQDELLLRIGAVLHGESEPANIEVAEFPTARNDLGKRATKLNEEKSPEYP